LVPRLFREGLTTKPGGEGTGLGSQVVYRGVLETKSARHFTTVPGRGTCITLYLPA
jgi:signal transduction histidine kinase